MIPHRERIEAAQEAETEAVLTEFIDLLILALEVPEVRTAIAQAVVTHQRADRVTLPPKPQVPARGQRHERGRRG